MLDMNFCRVSLDLAKRFRALRRLSSLAFCSWTSATKSSVRAQLLCVILFCLEILSDLLRIAASRAPRESSFVESNGGPMVSACWQQRCERTVESASDSI